jgi:VCBS repeat-containing protein
MAGKSNGKGKGLKIGTLTEIVEKPVNGGDGDNTIDQSTSGAANRINGGDGNDNIVGTGFADRVNAGDGDDTVMGGAGDDVLFGNDGKDTAAYEGSIFNFIWEEGKGNSLTVTDTTGAEGVDTLKHFECLSFDDYTFDLTGPNAALILADDQGTDEDNATTFGIQAWDFDGGSPFINSITVTGGGTVSAAATGALAQGMGTGTSFDISYDPNGAYETLAVGDSTTETITVEIDDGQGNLSSKDITITITGVNDAPTLGAGVMGATEDGAVEVLDLSALGDDIDSDDDGSTLTYTVTGTPSEGAASIAGTALSFDPGADFQNLAVGETRDVVVEVTATDAHGATAVNNVTITVTGTNDAPTLSAAATSAVEDGASIDVDLAALGDDVDSDDDGSTLAYTVSGAPAEGSASIAGTTLTFDPGADFQDLAVGETRNVVVEVTATDQHGATAVNNVTVTVTGTNDAPVIGIADSAGSVQALTLEQATPMFLSGALTADNYFDLYISTDDTVTGTHIVGGSNWGYAYGFSGFEVDPAETTYLHVVARNVGGPGGLIGEFSLTGGTGLEFANGTTSLYTNASDWLVSTTAFGSNYAAAVDEGTLGVSPWGSGGTLSNISSDASWIWNYYSNGSSDWNTLYFRTEISLGDNTLTDSGSIEFGDVDLSDTHTVSVTANGSGYLGDMSAVLADASTGDGAGSIDWDFAVSNEDLAYLAEGESLTQSYTVTVTDNNGASDSEVVTVTLNGTNDDPVIGAADVSGSVTAQPVTQETTGSAEIEFTVNQYLGYGGNSEATMRSIIANPSGYQLFSDTTDVIDYTDDPAGFSGELPGSTPWPAEQHYGNGGTGQWYNNNFFAHITTEFSVGNADTYTFRTFNDDGVFLYIDGVRVIYDTGYHPERPYEGSIALSPGNHTLELFFFEGGGEASLELSVRDSSGVYGLLGGGGGGLSGTGVVLTDSGSIDFTDVDLSDTHTVSVTPNGSGYLGDMTASLADASTGDGAGSVDWDFSVSNDDLVYLAAGESLTQSYTVTVTDNNGASDTEIVTITLNGTNDDPTASAIVAPATNEDAGAAAIDLLSTAADVDLSDDLDVANVAVSSSDGRSVGYSVDNETGAFSLDPSQFNDLAVGESATVTVDYDVDDGNGGVVANTASITVEGRNDAPTAAAISAPNTNEDAGVANIDLLATASDADTSDDLDVANVSVRSSDGRSLAYSVDAETGAFSFNAGQYNDLAVGESATVTVNYDVTDGNGSSVANTATIVVEGRNDTPTVASAIVVGDADQVVIDFTGILDAGYYAGAYYTEDGFIFDATGNHVDRNNVMNWHDGGANPGDNDIVITHEDGLAFDLVSMDVNQNSGLQVQSSAGNVAISGTGNKAIGIEGVTSARLETSGTSEVDNLVLALGGGVSEDEADFSVDLLQGASDPDTSDVLNVANLVITSGDGSGVSQNGNTLDVSPNAYNHLAEGETETIVVSYDIVDGNGGSVAQTATITIAGENDAPIAFDDSAFTTAATAITLDLAENDIDPDGDALSVSSVGTASNGSVVLNNDGTVTYTPNAGFAGFDTFNYQVSDGNGGFDTASVTMTVGRSDSTTVGNDVFLQGNFMELGVAGAGSLGSANAAPSGYHPNASGGRISYIVDMDGWDAGSASAPTQSGDATLPGSPVDGFVVGYQQSGITRNFANDERTYYNQLGATTVDTSSGAELSATTTGSAGSALAFQQVISLNPNDTYYTTTVTFTNTSGSDMQNVRFMRTFDPDQDVAYYGTYNTANDVLSNPDANSDIAISQALGTRSGVSVNLIAIDEDARGSNFGFANRDAYHSNAWDNPYDRNGGYVDQAITMTFNIASLAAGETVTKSFVTSMNGAGSANDYYVGSNGANTIDVGAGDDVVIAMGGNDTVTLGAGDDVFIFAAGHGADVITDFNAGTSTADSIDISSYGLSGLGDIQALATDVGADVLIDFGGGNSIRLTGVNEAQLHEDDFIF